MWWIIIPSLLLGFTSGAIYTFGYAIIRDCFEQKQAGGYLGFVSTMMSAGSLVAPLLVAALVQAAGWRMVPLVQAILWAVCVVMVLCGARITKEEGEKISYVHGKFDGFGTVAVACLLGGLILALSLGRFAPIGSPVSFAFFGLAALGLILLIVDIRKKKEDAIIPNIAFKDRNTIALTMANFLSPFHSMSTNFFLPAFVMTVLARTPVESSLALSVYSIAGVFLSPVLGRWVAKRGTAKPVAIWYSGVWRIVITVALLFALRPGTNIIVIYVIMILAGFYNLGGGVIATTGAQIMLDPKIRQQGNALVQLGQNFGGSLGVAVYSAIIAAYGLIDGMQIGLIVSCVGAFGVVVAGLMMKKPAWQDQSGPTLEAK
jgi:MFS family permease